MGNKLKEASIVDLFLVVIVALVVLEPTWPVCVALLIAASLKGFHIYHIKPSRKDEILALEEKFNHLRKEINGVRLKIGLDR